MQDRIEFEGGDILATEEPLTITGLLLPYNEVGRTNVGRFQVEAGTVKIPADPAVVGANIDHVRHDVVGRSVRLEDKPEGVFATIKFADTEEGRAAYEDAISPTGKRKKLSAEFGPAVIKAGKLVAGHAKLWGAALVEAGAFPSAQVLAADTADEEEPPASGEPTVTTEKFTDEFVDEQGKKHKRTVTTVTRTEPDGEGGTKTTITEKTVLEEPDSAEPAEQEEEPAVSVPETLAAKSVAPAKKIETALELRNVYASIASFKANPSDDAARQVLAALTDVKISGTNALPASGVLRENWVGPVWQGRTYVRKYITLGKLGTDISAMGKKGFTIARGTSGAPVDHLGSDWAGNKVEVPTGTGHTATLASTLARFAFAADFAREFWDLPGGQEVVEAFIRLIIEDYAWWSDNKALDAWIAAAGTAVAPGTYPTEYGGALGMLIQGILAVEAANDTPTFAIVNQTAYTDLLYTPKDLIPEFVNFAFRTDGTGEADGRVTVVTAPDAEFAALEEDEPAVLVGARNAIEFDEIGETPIQVDALEIAKGGVDKAVHGYLQTFTVRPESVVLIGTVATP